MPVALATSTAAVMVSTPSFSSSSISTTLLFDFKVHLQGSTDTATSEPGAQEGYKSLIGVLVTQCVALQDSGPHTKLN